MPVGRTSTAGGGMDGLPPLRGRQTIVDVAQKMFHVGSMGIMRTLATL